MRRAALLALAAAAAACGSSAEPRFAASCAPDAAMEHVVCTVRNEGSAPGRGCLAVSAQPPESTPILARRVCTGVLGPQQSVEIKPQFEQLDRARRNKTLISRCAKAGQWICAITITEISRELPEAK